VSGVAGRTTGQKRVQTYKSTAYRCRNSCYGSHVREAVVREAILAAILSLQDDVRLDELVGETPSQNVDLSVRLADAQKALAQVAKERNNLTLAFMREAIRLDEYEPMMAELRARHDAIAVTITQLEDTIAETPTVEKRRSQLEEIRDKGIEMLDHPDTTTANVWLRRHFMFVAEMNEVVLVKII